ncbi:MAG TPA: class I SAM-dependent methyltransferase [Fulvivirga sp.]|nr:class I SAM-dependent methyltransferase [Fulvivirga sp.]
MKNNFNRIAPMYDMLSKTIFGNTIRNAQKSHLNQIEAKKRIVIVGGGSGKILLDLNQLGLELDVIYVELSTSMMERAMAIQPIINLNVEFVCADVLQMELPASDVIITNFFLDVFTEPNLNAVMIKLAAALRPNGIWLCTDFVLTRKFFNDMLVWAMYAFFRVTTNLEGGRLLDFEEYFSKIGFQCIVSKTYFNRMIMSSCYKRT